MEPKFKPGDMVRKIKGSQWHGRVVGTYSTDLTPEGYAVESATERGSVQIYPAAALERDDHSGQWSKQDRRAVRVLLAAMNRDGGDHQHRVGIAQAAKDALAEFDRLRQEIAERSDGAQTAPAGWQMVPVASTVEMEDAGCKAASRLMGMSEAGRVYRAMLAAAPAAPVAREPVALEQRCRELEGRADALSQELKVVLSDWNALVHAIQSPTHGGAVGHAAGIVRERDALRSEVERLRKDAARYQFLRDQQSLPPDTSATP